MQSQLVNLLEQQQIRDLLYRYCRGIDRMDREMVRSCYHTDAVDEHGSFNGNVDEFMDWCWRLLSRYSMSMHYLSNILIEIEGHRALVESYGTAVHRGDKLHPERNLVVGFRFVDVFEKRSGEWRIDKRVATTEWVSRHTEENEWPIADTLRTGQRDKSDIVYQHWQS